MNIILSLTIFIFLVSSFFFIGRKISAWTTISRLGFSSETPEAFLKHTKIYHLILIVLFFIAIIPLVFTNITVFVLGFIVLLSIAFITAILGRTEGVKTYKKVLLKMLDKDKSLNNETRREIIQQLAKSDAHLLGGLRLFY